MSTFNSSEWVRVEPRSDIPVVALILLGPEAYGGCELLHWLGSIAVVMSAIEAPDSSTNCTCAAFHHQGQVTIAIFAVVAAVIIA